MAEQECPLCGGTGWKIVEREGLSAAERCSCLNRDRSAELLEKARIPANYRNDRFENFSDRGSNELRGILTMLLRYCDEFPAVDPPGLLFIGDPGTGKTHLAVAVLRRLIENGFAGVFMDYQMLLERIRASYDPASGESPREAYETALESEVLLLDDLGAHRVTDWVEDTVTSIITHRCNERRPLIATTNLPDPDMGGKVIERMPDGAPSRYDIRTTLLDRIGMRARSRLFEMCRVIRMPKVDDYRIVTRKQA
jgi:DNA replication protein DnaC